LGNARFTNRRKDNGKEKKDANKNDKDSKKEKKAKD
jgi:hypothetical protein